MTTHEWKGHKIEVSSHALPKHLWMTISLKVVTDGNNVFESPKELEGFKTKVPFEITDQDDIIKGVLITVKPTFLLLTKYKLIVDNMEIATGKVRSDNWYMFYGLVPILVLAIYVFQKITNQ